MIAHRKLLLTIASALICFIALAVPETSDGISQTAAVSYKGATYVLGTQDGEPVFCKTGPSNTTMLAPFPGGDPGNGCTMCCQHNGREDAIFLIGGENSDKIWAYLPVHDEWKACAQPTDTEGYPLRIANAKAESSGSSHILVTADDGTVYAYHTITDTWIPLEERSQTTFGWLNYTVIILYLLAMLGVGFYFSRRNNSSDKFFKGGGKIPWWAAGISIFATALSAITFLSIPAKAYAADWGMFMFNMAIPLIVPLITIFYLPLIRKLKVASIYQYLEERFSSSARFLASAFFCLFMFARIAVILFLPSLALNAVTGINIYLCIVLMGIVTIIYSTLGGIEAVVWGDVIQGFLLVGGAVLALVWIIHDVDGGFRGMMDIAVDNSKFKVFDFSLDWTRPVFWVAITGGVANQLLTYTSDQSVVQKYLTVKDERGTKRSIVLNGLLVIPITFLFFGIGTALFAFFKTHPAMLDPGMSNTDSIFPHYIMCCMPKGLAGLLIAAVFAAAMSTLSSNINSSTTVMSVDFFSRLKPGCNDTEKVRFARRAGVVVGSLGVAMAVALASLPIASLWDQFNFFLGLLTSGVGGLFMMGVFTKRIGTRAAFTGFASSIIILLLCNSLTNITSTLYGFIGLISCLAIGYLSSFIWGYGK